MTVGDQTERVLSSYDAFFVTVCVGSAVGVDSMGGPSRLSSGKFKCCFSNNWYPRYRRVARPPLEGCAIPLLNDSQWCCDVKWQENDNAMRSRRNASGEVRADDLEHWTRDAQKEFAQNLFIAIEVTHQPIHSHHRASKNRTRFYNRHLSVSLWEKQKNTCSIGRLGGWEVGGV